MPILPRDTITLPRISVGVEQCCEVSRLTQCGHIVGDYCCPVFAHLTGCVQAQVIPRARHTVVLPQTGNNSSGEVDNF